MVWKQSDFDKIPLSLTFLSAGSLNSSCYEVDDCMINTWIGDAEDDWDDSPNNWTLRRIPLNCDAILVPNGNELIMSASTNERCEGLKVESGSALEVNGELTVDRLDQWY